MSVPATDMSVPPTPKTSNDNRTVDSGSSVLDELFDSVESASAGSESGSFS